MEGECTCTLGLLPREAGLDFVVVEKGERGEKDKLMILGSSQGVLNLRLAELFLRGRISSSIYELTGRSFTGRHVFSCLLWNALYPCCCVMGLP